MPNAWGLNRDRVDLCLQIAVWALEDEGFTDYLVKMGFDEHELEELANKIVPSTGE